MKDNTEDARKREGPGDCLTPTATLLLLVVAVVVTVGRWAVGA